MKIKKLYCNPKIESPYMVLESLDGRFFRFHASTAWRFYDGIFDVEPLPTWFMEMPYYTPVGNNGIEATADLYKVCGFEKAEG